MIFPTLILFVVLLVTSVMNSRRGYATFADIAQIKKDLGVIDILVCNAGYLSKLEKLEEADPEEWWKGYEINVRGAFNCTRAFLSVCASKAILVDVSTAVAHIPQPASCSAYGSSKLAATKVYESFGVENPHIEVTHVHPGTVESDMNAKSGMGASDGGEIIIQSCQSVVVLTSRSADLPASFIVWMCSPEASFLRGGGKCVWCNWNVDELKARKDELSKPGQLAVVMNGWPHPN